MTEQADPNASRLQSVDDVILTPVVRRAIDRPDATILTWRYQTVSGGFGGGLGGTFIYRFDGEVRFGMENRHWSVILKIIHARTGEALNSTHYWKREFEIYQSGWLDDLPGRFRAVKIYETTEYPGEACWVWMEDVRSDLKQPWPNEHYGVAARHLGQFNGTYLMGRPIPEADWLGTAWLRNIAQTAEQHVPRIQNMLRDPELLPFLPSNAEELFNRLWDERERFLNALDQLPQTFCHQDPVARNLFVLRAADGNYDTIAIDWAFVGRAAVGMDIAVPLVIGLGFIEIDAADALELKTMMYSSYLEGLRDTGWDGDPRNVQLGFVASAVGKYIEVLMLSSQFMTDPNMLAVFEQTFGHPTSKIRKQFGETFRFVFGAAEEARQLMEELEM
ncbi:MAG: phosphotransferase [Anaerolineae bacterium]